MVNRVEALADAIGKINGMSDPTSEAYQLRNPGRLRAYSLTRMQPQNEAGRRVFAGLLGGYRALLNDLEEKCRTTSRAKLKQEATLRDLLAVYELGHPVAVKQAVTFLRGALGEAEVCAGTGLAWFLESVPANVESVRL